MTMTGLFYRHTQLAANLSPLMTAKEAFDEDIS
jgi:hypothetical protein